MSHERRYFILSEALPKSLIPHLLGRVVQDKTFPNRSFAPFDLRTSHNVSDIIPDTLPEPVTWNARNDFYSHATGWSLGGGLADLLNIELSSGKEKGAAVQSDQVKCYTMPNTLLRFQRLMGDEGYASDVHELLRRCKSGRAYFVTGFLTATDGIFTSFHLRSQKTQLEVTAPVLEAMGASIPPLGNAGNPVIGPSVSSSQRHETSMSIADEVIFAVSYDVIKSSRSLDMEAKMFIRRQVINAGPKRAKPKHLAFTDWADDCDDDDEEDSEGETEFFEGLAEEAWAEDEQVVFVKTDLNGDELFGAGDDNLASFNLRP